MAAVTAFPWFDIHFTTALGPDAASYQILQYVSGTTTAQLTYSDIAGTVPNTQPVVLDASGRCTMYGTPGQSYTFVLLLPVAQGSTQVKTWNNVNPAAAATTGTYVPLDGSVAMTGLLTLVSDPTSALNAATKQYVDAQITAGVASATAAAAAATAAAAAATAAAAAITPTSYRLFSANCTAASRAVTLAPGTWTIALQTFGHCDDAILGTTSQTITQSATVGTATSNTSFVVHRTGGAGYGRDNHGSNMGTSSLVVAASASFTMTLNAASLGIATGMGSILTAEKVA